MNNALLGAGLACVIAAIIGGGFKGFGIEIPLLQSVHRQLLLAAAGIFILVGVAIATWLPTILQEYRRREAEKIQLSQHGSISQEQIDQFCSSRQDKQTIYDIRVASEKFVMAQSAGKNVDLDHLLNKVLDLSKNLTPACQQLAAAAGRMQSKPLMSN